MTSRLAHVDLTPDALLAHLRPLRARSERAGVLAVLADACRDRVPMLQAAAREAGVALAGGVFPQLITRDGFSSEGVWLLSFDVMPPMRVVDGWAHDADASARTVLDFLDEAQPAEPDGEAPTLFLLVDALVPNLASVLERLYLEAGDRARYAGVAAGSESFEPFPCLFDGERSVARGAVCLLLGASSYPAIAHGYAPPERSMTATATEGNRVQSIDWRPAFDVYRELIAREYGVELTRENFYRYGVNFPLGILRACGEMVVRLPVGLADDGSIFCVGEVPDHAVLTLLRAPSDASSSCVDLVARTVRATVGPRPLDHLLTFYCAGRRLQIGAHALDELRALDAQVGAEGFGGALTLGELGSEAEWSYPLFHNTALVCATWDGP